MSGAPLRWLCLAVAAVLVNACGQAGPGATGGVDTAVTTKGTAAPIVAIEPDDLPAPLADRRVVDAGWEALPYETEGVFVGLGKVTDHAVHFSAVAADGTILWETQRPLTCTGFAVTSADGRPLAVLTDTAPGTTSVVTTTASAFDIHTGQQVWGPVQVPGPHVGPGLVFSAVVPGGAMGANGPAVALDAGTGEVAANEEHLAGDRIVGEYDGTVLIAGDRFLHARDAGDGGERWRVPFNELGGAGPGSLAAAPGVAPGHGPVFVGDDASGYALLDLGDGAVIATGMVDTATDAGAGVHVVISRTHVSGYRADGALAWEQPVDPGTRIAGASNGVLYLQLDNLILTRDTATGEVVSVYDTPGPAGAVYPRQGTAAGAAVLETADGLMLATTTPAPPAATSPSTGS